MTKRTILWSLLIFFVILFVLLASIFFFSSKMFYNIPTNIAPSPVTLSGTYVCLPLMDSSATTTCDFGIKLDDGEFYAVNFGQSASAMEQFKNRAHIRAEGFIVYKENLSTDHWTKYNMKGIFTITQLLDVSSSTIESTI